jgi:hypothetical protein
MAARTEKRKFPRKPLWYPAKIDLGDGSAIRDCQLRDVSETGARIKIEKLNDLPDEFVLVLANMGNPHRRCHVVWQTATEAGVQFLGGNTEAGHDRSRVKLKA